jgi:hypothetical protein
MQSGDVNPFGWRSQVGRLRMPAEAQPGHLHRHGKRGHVKIVDSLQGLGCRLGAVNHQPIRSMDIGSRRGEATANFSSR